MGVGSVTSMNSMSSVWTNKTGSKDIESKKIENEITDRQQQMQKVSAKEELSADEKADERKKQQREISDLNAELKRHQNEVLNSQRRELMMAELEKNEGPEDEEKTADKIQADETDKKSIAEKETKTIDNDASTGVSNKETSAAVSTDKSAQQTGYQGTVIFQNNDGTVILKDGMEQDEKRVVNADQKQTSEAKEKGVTARETKAIDDDKDADTGLSGKKMYEMVSADASSQQISRRETAISGIKSDIAVLKGEINQDERRGVDTEKKQAELEKLEKKEESARTLQFSDLGKDGGTMNATANLKVSGIEANKENSAVINFPDLSKEDQESQQRFQVSFGN
ncbi:MAG: hypothetical protein HDR19_04790 [Lachnospiraceae bacterium]|nr:hypothetical protein [Lachnospiraceae bacterium]